MNQNQSTHAVTKPNSTESLTITTFKEQFKSKMYLQIKNYLDGDENMALRFSSAVLSSVRQNPELLKCDPGSLFEAFAKCAEYNLFPSSVSGEAYVLPYKSKEGMVAQFQLGYQGLITLLYRSGVESVQTEIVFENDTFEYQAGTEQTLIHRPDVFKDRGKPIGVYAVATIKGSKVFKVLSKDDVLKFKEFSKSKGSEYSPWNEKNDPERWMWRKTCIKQLAKELPKNSKAYKAIDQDNQDSIISDRKSKLDLDGPATVKSLHASNQIENEPEQTIE